MILAPFSKLKKVYNYINESSSSEMEHECFGKNRKMRELYQTYYKLYERVRDDSGEFKFNVSLVGETQLNTCPYCNRDYINARGNKVSGAQLDHFYNRSEYPIFSVCLYN